MLVDEMVSSYILPWQVCLQAWPRQESMALIQTVKKKTFLCRLVSHLLFPINKKECDFASCDSVATRRKHPLLLTLGRSNGMDTHGGSNSTHTKYIYAQTCCYMDKYVKTISQINTRCGYLGWCSWLYCCSRRC